MAEGVNKLRDPKPFTAPFFTASKGPLASTFQGMVWDADGKARLDREVTWETWKRFRDQVVSHYGFDEDQAKLAERIAEGYLNKADAVFEDDKEDINTYFRGLERRDKNRENRVRQEVASLRGQQEKIESELKKDRGKWLGPLDKLWTGLEKDLNAIATPQQQKKGAVKLQKPSRSALDSVGLDQIIPYSHIAIGICLIIGLFTRTAALGAAAFLLSVIATQPPWIPDAAPVYYQMVEVLAVVVVATAGAGRHAGIDSLIRMMRMRCCPPKVGA